MTRDTRATRSSVNSQTDGKTVLFRNQQGGTLEGRLKNAEEEMPQLGDYLPKALAVETGPPPP